MFTLQGSVELEMIPAREHDQELMKDSDKILLVGEGDFSFAACLAKAFGSATNMVATSLDPRGEGQIHITQRNITDPLSQWEIVDLSDEDLGVRLRLLRAGSNADPAHSYLAATVVAEPAGNIISMIDPEEHAFEFLERRDIYAEDL
ncbi:hypothetical protein Dimus_016539 [Dionaea muscipula]